MACDESKPKRHYTLLEVIDVEGTCFEDHVGKRDSYAGQIVRWKTDETGEVMTYGSLERVGDMAQRVIDEVKNPTRYYTPFMIDLLEITIDTSQPVWTLVGVSDNGEGKQGYASTCELRVVKRGKELRDPTTQKGGG